MSFALLRVTWMQLLIYCSTVFQYTLKYHITLHLNALLLFQFGQKQNCRTRQRDIREYDKVQRKITQKYYIHNQVKMCLHHLKISVAEPILFFFDSLFKVFLKIFFIFIFVYSGPCSSSSSPTVFCCFKMY